MLLNKQGEPNTDTANWVDHLSQMLEKKTTANTRARPEEKRSGEVWQMLSAVKGGFGNFSGCCKRHMIQTGLNQLEDVVGVRTRAIEKRLKGVETISDAEVKSILPEITNDVLQAGEE